MKERHVTPASIVAIASWLREFVDWVARGDDGSRAAVSNQMDDKQQVIAG
jgi:hypothetical protein